MAEYTQNASRPDLAVVEVNKPEGFIADQVMPIVPVADKSGTIYYATLTADAAAQTSRTAGTAPTSTQISDSSTSYTCAQYEKRGSVTPDEAKQMGGIAKADMVGSRYAKRQVMRAYETRVCAELLGLTASATFDAAKILTQSQTALDSIRLYEGKTLLVAGTSTLKKMVQAILADNVQVNLFSRIISGSTPAVAASGLNFKQWMDALAMFMGIDGVLAGDSNIWAGSGYSEKIAFLKQDNSGDPLAHKYIPVFGKTYQFLPDGNQPWDITSVADLVAKNNHYDAEQWLDTVALNTGAAYILDGVV